VSHEASKVNSCCSPLLTDLWYHVFCFLGCFS